MSDSSNEIPKDVAEYLELSSVHLTRLNAENLPGGIASGLLIDYKNKRFLCTAAHCLNNGPLSLQMEWSNSQRVTSTRPLNLQPIFSRTVTKAEDFESGSEDDLDFAFCEIGFDDIPLHQELDNENLSGEVKESRECKIYKDTDLAVPQEGVEYGFFGQVRPKYEPYPHPVLPDDVRYLNAIGRVCYPLAFIGEEDGYYIFKPRVLITDHKDYQGCSGAPIVDLGGKVVALVCCGNIDRSIIYGFPIQRFCIVLEVLASGILNN